MKIVLVLAIVIFSCQGQEQKSKILGSWILIEEKSDVETDESIMSVPESEKSAEPAEEEASVLKLKFSEPNELTIIDNGAEQTATFNINGSQLFLGNREYRIKELSESKLIYLDEGLLGTTEMIFERINE